MTGKHSFGMPGSRQCALAPSGFTLIEMLIVIVVIGVVVAMATLSVNVLGRDSQIEDQSQRFWAVLQQAREESELQSLDVGVYVAAQAYEFLRWDARRNLWIPIVDDKLYATRRLPEGLRFRLWLDSREVVLKPSLPDRSTSLGKELDEEAKKEAELPEALRTINRDEPPPTTRDPPQLVILSSGDIMPFELQIERDRQPAQWRLIGSPENDLRVERMGNDQRWIVISQTNAPIDAKGAQAHARK